MKIYTLGYSGWKLDDVATVLDRLDGILIDVRMVPRSRNPAFNVNYLAKTFTNRYKWLRQFGNVNYKNGGPIAIVDFDAGTAELKPLADQGKAIILLCGCPNIDVCHRKVLADRLASRWGAEIVHLTPRNRQVGSQPTLF